MPYLQNIVQPFSRKKKQDPFLSTYICTILVHVVQLVGLVGLEGFVSDTLKVILNESMDFILP